VANHDAVRGEEPDFGVLNFLRLAVLFHDLLRTTQVWPWHRGEQVVLDLVVEATHEVIHEVSTTNVAAREHLTTQEVDLGALGQDRHPLVVRRERSAHVETENSHLDSEERESHPQGQEAEHDREVTDVAHEQQSDLDPALVDLLFEVEYFLESMRMKVEALEQQCRKEEIALAVGHELRYSLETDSLFLLENDEIGFDVGIFVNGVRIRVVTRVLVHPPGVANSHDEVRHESTESVVEFARLENLSMSQLMSQERVLRENDPHSRGDEEDVPRAGEHREADPSASHGEGDDGKSCDVKALAASQQSGLAHSAQEGGEVAHLAPDAAGSSLNYTYGIG